MKRLIRFSLFCLIIYILVRNFGHIYYPYMPPWIESAGRYFSELTIIRTISSFLDNAGLSLSVWLTLILLAFCILYFILHAIEWIVKLILTSLNRPARPLKHKTRVGKMIRATIIFKLAVIVLNLFLLCTQAFSIHRFFSWISDKPKNLSVIIREDFLFFIILLVLLGIQIIKSGNTDAGSSGGYGAPADERI